MPMVKAEQISMEELANQVYGEETAEYRAFVDKFKRQKTRKTTDDCYTPPNIYNVVANWVESEYGVSRANFVRPFYPGGDYEHADYPVGCIVVDNPPFSILAKILEFYLHREIPFFLFAPTLTLFQCLCGRRVTAICVGGRIEYENGAIVNTSFVTNMDNCIVRTAPDLLADLTRVNRSNQGKAQLKQTKISYPKHVITSARVCKWSKHGIQFRVGFDEGRFCRELDAQRARGKEIFGGGVLVNDAKAAEAQIAETMATEAAEKEKIKYELSERE